MSENGSNNDNENFRLRPAGTSTLGFVVFELIVVMVLVAGMWAMVFSKVHAQEIKIKQQVQTINEAYEDLQPEFERLFESMRGQAAPTDGMRDR